MDIQINLAELYRDSAQPWMAVDTCRGLLQQHTGDLEAIQFHKNLQLVALLGRLPSLSSRTQKEMLCLLMERYDGRAIKSVPSSREYQALSRRQYLMANNEVKEQFRKPPAFVVIDETTSQRLERGVCAGQLSSHCLKSRVSQNA